jgi:mRNA interferase RelE/StbE
MFRLELRRAAVRALRRMNRSERTRIETKLDELALDPYAAHLDVRKLTGRTAYRLRVGDWRVLYQLDDKVCIIDVEDIRQRGSAYQ